MICYLFQSKYSLNLVSYVLFKLNILDSKYLGTHTYKWPSLKCKEGYRFTLKSHYLDVEKKYNVFYKCESYEKTMKRGSCRAGIKVELKDNKIRVFFFPSIFL